MLENSKLTLFTNKALKILNGLAKFCLVIVILFGIFASLMSLFGGKIGQLKAISEWRVLSPMLLTAFVHFFALLLISEKGLEISQTLVNGDPFVPQNGEKLRQIAFILIGLEIARYIIKIFTGLIIFIFGQPDSGQMSVKFGIDFGIWLAILILLVLANVFKEGARLRQLDKLTI